MEYLKRAADLANKIGAKGVEANSLSGIGGVYAKFKNGERALSYFEKAIKAAEETGDNYLLIATLEPIADDYIRLGEVARARAALIKLSDLDTAVLRNKKSAEVRRKIEELPK